MSTSCQAEWSRYRLSTWIVRQILLRPFHTYVCDSGQNLISYLICHILNHPLLQINVLLLGQASLEKILRSHLQKYGCEVELSTELRSFEQHSNHVVARVVKTAGETETVEMVTCHWLVGTDGAKGNILLLCCFFLRSADPPIGIVRKELGLTFSGETRHNEHYILGDIEVQGLDAAVCPSYHSILM